MKRKILLAAQLIATVLFVTHYRANADQNPLAWATPLAVLIMIVINSVWVSRFLSWLIFAVSFFALLVILSAFTLRWRLEPGFSPAAFYRALLMYTFFVYISLGQLKTLGGSSREETKV